jgi:tRNA1(Val) A37 N6-methylase TrmN6
MARPGGTASLIHRSDTLGELLAALDGRFGALAVLPVHPRADEPASRVLVQGVKGSRAALRLLPGLVLHGEGNRFQPAVEAVLRHGAALDLRDRHGKS